MKKNKYVLLSLIILIVLIVSGVIYIVYNSFVNLDKDTNKVNVINRIEDYDYKLEDNETKLYKDLFGKLEEILLNDGSEEDYAKTVAKLFIADFYNLDNKVTKNDVGGVQFIYEDNQDNFILKAKDTLYKYIENNLYGDRKQELPSVASVEVVSIEQIPFEYGDKKDNKAYSLELSWTYDKDLGYQDEVTMILIHIGKKLSIAEFE